MTMPEDLPLGAISDTVPLVDNSSKGITYESHKKVETCKKKEIFKKEETISVSDVEEEESISEKDDEEV